MNKIFTMLFAVVKGIFSIFLMILLQLPFIIGIVFIHELGHYFASIAFGHVPSMFSIGFGKPIFSYDAGFTTFQLAAIPLGGYVLIDFTALSFTGLIVTLFAGPLFAILFTLAVMRSFSHTNFMNKLRVYFVFFGISLQVWNLLPMPIGQALTDGGRIIQGFTGFTPPSWFFFVGIVALYMVIDPLCQKIFGKRRFHA